MASKRDEAFAAFYARLTNKGGIGGQDILRAAWEAGRQYEAERRIALARASIEAYMQGDDEHGAED